jgi:hypothetical protein
MSFIEVACDPSALGQRSVHDVILAALLDTSEAELDAFVADPECARALDLLRTSGLDLGPELKCLTDEVARTVQRLERKVMRVTLDGETVWQRA